MIKKLAVIVLLIIVSCDQNRDYDSYISIENKEWNIKTPVVFNVPIQDTLQAKNVFINIRNNQDFAFRNLFLITKIISPDKTQKIDTLEYEMFDVFGRSLGNGITDIKESKSYFLENFTFPKQGEYQFEFSHAMRQRGQVNGINKLQGIVDLGLRIESIK